MLAAFGCGLLAVLSQAPISVPWVLFLAVPGLYLLWERALSPRKAFWIGWVAGVGYFAGGLHWIIEPFLVDAATFGWMIPFALFGMSTGLALFWGAGFWLAKRFAPTGAWNAPFILSAGWIGLEWLRGNILTGFPWGLLGYAWIDTPVMQSAAWIGIYGVTLLTVLAGALIGYGVSARCLPWRIGSAGASVALVGFTWVAGAVQLGQPIEENGSGPLIGLVQPNVAQKDKWQPHLRDAQITDLIEKTRILSEQGADVVIWPEAASPYPVARSPRLRAVIADALKPGGILLAGSLRYENLGSADQRAFNSLIAVGHEGDVLASYDKRHLVPFGEYLPFDDFFSRMGLREIAALPGGMASGVETGRRLGLPNLPVFAPMICYEAIFPAEIMALKSDARWLVQITNDAWFGEHTGPYQHFVQARVRAIERGLPLARSANTGISAIVDAKGRILSYLPLNEANVMMSSLPKPQSATIYSLIEDTFFGVLICIFMFTSFLLREPTRG